MAMLEGGGGPPVSDIVRSDWLDVQSRVLRLWERRWVILEQNRLLVYRPPTIKDAAVGHGRLVLELRCDKVFNIQGPLTEAHVLYLQTGTGSLILNQKTIL